MSKLINGFSKLSKIAKIDWLSKNYIQDNHFNQNIISESWYQNEPVQKVLEGFSENTISNFHLPFGLAPNFLINGNPYCIPMAIEESSVVAAASAAAIAGFLLSTFSIRLAQAWQVMPSMSKISV